MKKVEFVDIKSKLSGWGGIKGNKYSFPNIKEIIEDKIKDGWSYRGFVPNTIRADGEMDKLTLVFERDE